MLLGRIADDLTGTTLHDATYALEESVQIATHDLLLRASRCCSRRPCKCSTCKPA